MEELILIENYQKHQCDVSFRKLFLKYEPLIKTIVSSFSKNRPHISNELVSVLNEEFWMILKDYDINRGVKLKGFIDFRLTRKAKWVLQKKEGTYLKRVSLQCSLSDTYLVFDSPDIIDIEQGYIDRQETKTNADKRQLISVLVENTDPLTTAIVNEFLNCTSSERPTPTAIGRKLGIHHEKVKRALRKLAKRYDERQFGSIDAYLAV